MMRSRRIGVDKGMAGYFAVLYDDEDAIDKGPNRFASKYGAAAEAYQWSRMCGVPVDESTSKLLDALERWTMDN